MGPLPMRHHKPICICLSLCKHACKAVCDVTWGTDPYPLRLGRATNGAYFFVSFEAHKSWLNVFEIGAKFYISEKIFWG